MIDQSNLILPIHIRGKLADPNLHIPGNIDILIGREVFFSIQKGKIWTISYTSLHSTYFGWIVTGKLPLKRNYSL